jgi:microcin C transport system substrate-binding protein
VLLWGHYVVPNWHIKTWRVAYWNRFEHPKVTPQYDIGLHTWWAREKSPEATADVTVSESTPGAEQ